MATNAKKEFIIAFNEIILKPRHLNYKLQFTGPTGTNAVEAALKLARKYTKRKTIACFRSSFHGMTMGSLSVSTSVFKDNFVGETSEFTKVMPFYNKDIPNTLDYIERYLHDSLMKNSLPAAFIIEVIQGEGGVNIADGNWLLKLQSMLKIHDVLLIVDDIQVGCGRTGTFFSFDDIELTPDIICLSKSLSGYGTPLSLILIEPRLDIWSPGEHNGTFRGNNLSFITAMEALSYWKNDELSIDILKKSKIIHNKLKLMKLSHPNLVKDIRGVGMIWGIDFGSNNDISYLVSKAFKHGLLIETCGESNNVLKLMPPLTIDVKSLLEGLRIIEKIVVPT